VSRVDVRGIRRTQILDAAQRLVAERGWNGTTFADICREAGVSNGVLTYHFRDKEDLRLALFDRELERWRVYFGAMASKDVSPAHHASGAVKGASAKIEHDPEFFRTLFSYLCCDTAGRPELAARVSGFFAEMRDSMATHFARNAERGEFGGRTPEAAASVFQTVLLGYALGRIMLGIEPPKQDLIDLLAGYLSGETDRRTDGRTDGTDGAGG
jgi:AcrR family transcriptional regulator